MQYGRVRSDVRPLCAAPMAAGPDDIRGLIHSQGARIPHLPRSAAALSWQITAHVSKALSLDPEPGRKPARALGAWDHCLHGKLVFPGAAGCIVTITSGLLAYSLPLFVLLSFLTRGGRFFFIAVLPRYYGEPAIPSAAEAASAPVQWRSARYRREICRAPDAAAGAASS